MPNIEKCVVTWNGFTGSPGYSVFYFAAGQAAAGVSQLNTFFNAIKSYFPTAITWTTPTNGDIIDEATGKMNNIWSGGAGTLTAGTSAGAWASTSGALLRWETGQFRNGRKVRGRTFLVPIGSASYSTGTISTTTANAIQGAAASLLTGSANSVKVWSRPVYDHSVKPPVLKTPGVSYVVNSVVCPTKVVYLSQRRD